MSKRISTLQPWLACVIMLSGVSWPTAEAADAIDFDRHIRPLLSDNCFSCHGPDAAQRKADLRLDRRDDAIRSGAINDRELAASHLIERILSKDPDKVMPPADSHKKLSDAQKQLLKQWIEQGATYTQHWAFIAPKAPEVPAGENAVDYLVQQSLAREGLKLSPPADPSTLVRRLSLDLVGLPPTPEMIDRFSADPSPATIDQTIEQLLASPHYGERMSIAWLDVVRFADTIGYHSDTPRNVYPYRDYVIDSFNKNKPFDLFTIEQIAGDLLPDATQEQKIASCFNRLLLTTEEGGAQAKDYEARYMADRVRAIGTTWLGLTIGCSQCHDHKFDPITMHDFYSMGAFFADIDEAIIGKREEGLIVPSGDQATQWQMLKVNLSTLQSEFDAPHPQLAEEQRRWEEQQRAIVAAGKSWQAITFDQATGAADTSLTVQPDLSLLASGKRTKQETYKLTSTVSGKTQLAALRLEALPHASLPAGGSGRAGNGNFVLTEVQVSLQPAKGSARTLPLAKARASFEQTQKAEKHPQKRWSAASVIDKDASGSQWGWAILPEVTKPQQLEIQLTEPVTLDTGDRLVIEMLQNHDNPGHTLGHFRWSASSDPLAMAAPLGDSKANEIVAILETPESKRSSEQSAKLRAAFHQDAPSLASLRKQIASAQKELNEFEKQLPRCLISKSLAKPRLVRILPRGNWQDESGMLVTPKLPAFLTSGQTNSQRPMNRLDLARWLVSRDNPLTARVFMNRLWKQFFGIGLAKNLDDLGAQGEAPLNGPLLDYLAVEFVRSGWNVKHMVRLIVRSRTYQQSSLASPELLQRDPENRLIARQSRFRLPAELVRDNALAISGLLSTKVGGPSVKPYQPEGYWENLNFPQRSYTADPAPAQHRRGLYVWWQRSFVHPSMLAFDAPTREECAADRAQSNIPQQALVLLNDPTYLEAARALAVKMATSSTTETPERRIAQAFTSATARKPTETEISLLAKLFATSRQQYAADSQSAKTLVTNGGHTAPENLAIEELAAYIQTARAILNLHEVITRS